MPQRGRHEGRGQLREDLGRRGTCQSAPGLASDRDIENEPEARVIGHVLGHTRPGVEVELERRAERIGEILTSVKDKLEAAHRTHERRVREADGERFALRAGKSPSRHDLDVEVARRRIETAERARPE